MTSRAASGTELVPGHGSLTRNGKNEGKPMRITSKGQVTIPQAIREAAGFLPRTEVRFILEEDGVRIVKADPGAKPDRSRLLVDGLRGQGHRNLTTAEIMAMTRGD